MVDRITPTTLPADVERLNAMNRTDDNGAKFEVAEPWWDSTVEASLATDNPLDFLDIPAFAGADLRDSKAFTDLYLRFVREIRDNGAMKTLESIV